jgi:hypothetical protein
VSPHSYGAKSHITPDPDSLELLDASRKHRIQEILGSHLYYTRAVNKKLLIALIAIAARQAKATVATEHAMDLLLNYVATYLNDGIVYPASNMILCAHADAGFLNKTNSCCRAGAHIYLSEDDPFPRFNDAILSIAQIIKFIMALAAESELAVLFIAAQEMIPHRQTLIAMGWPQSKSPIQMDNSTVWGPVEAFPASVFLKEIFKGTCSPQNQNLEWCGGKTAHTFTCPNWPLPIFWFPPPLNAD